MSDSIYTARYSLVNGTQLEVPSGERPKMFRIALPPYGRVTKLIVKQVGGIGSLVAASVNLYDAQVGALHTIGNSESLTPIDFDKDLAKIIPTQAVVAGVALELFNTDGYAYRNLSMGVSNPERAIYLEIDPAAPGADTQWEVAITVVTPQPG